MILDWTPWFLYIEWMDGWRLYWMMWSFMKYYLYINWCMQLRGILMEDHFSKRLDISLSTEELNSILFFHCLCLRNNFFKIKIKRISFGKESGKSFYALSFMLLSTLPCLCLLLFFFYFNREKYLMFLVSWVPLSLPSLLLAFYCVEHWSIQVINNTLYYIIDKKYFFLANIIMNFQSSEIENIIQMWLGKTLWHPWKFVTYMHMLWNGNCHT